jgi:Ser/Thr protein kinase RdoA (MazF antagonist)
MMSNENDEKWQTILEGYKQYRELSEDELSLMKNFVEIREFWDTAEFLRFGYFYGQSIAEETAKRLERVFKKKFKE